MIQEANEVAVDSQHMEEGPSAEPDIIISNLDDAKQLQPTMTYMAEADIENGRGDDHAEESNAAAHDGDDRALLGAFGSTVSSAAHVGCSRLRGANDPGFRHLGGRLWRVT